MIISHKKKFIFVHNPKAAGTSFRKSIEAHHDHKRVFWGKRPNGYLATMMDMAHLRAWELIFVAPTVARLMDEYKTLAFARNPERRFISACYEHFRNFKSQLGFMTLDIESQKKHLRDLIETDLTIEKVISDVRYVHFSPQKWFFYLGGKRIVQHICPLFSAQDDFATAYDILELPRVPARIENRSRSDHSDALLTPEVLAFVRRFYAMDYEMFAALDHLAPLLTPPAGDTAVGDSAAEAALSPTESPGT